MYKTILVLVIFTSALFSLTTFACPEFSTNISRSEIGLDKSETFTHLHFYFHDVVTSEKPTVVQVDRLFSDNPTSLLFGSVYVMDDALTEGPNRSSKVVGRAQGTYTSASQTEIGLSMTMNFAFTEGKFNGSDLSVSGRNVVVSDVRELAVVGGTGVFRFARGYASVKTHTVDLNLGNAVDEYDVYVSHY